MKTQSSILIIEDSDEDYEVMNWALRQAGWTGYIVRTICAEDALNLITSGNGGMDTDQQDHSSLPCLILLDLSLPGIGGIAFLRELYQDGSFPAIPVIVVATSSHPGDMAVCRSLGAEAYVTKPASLEAYVKTMRDLLNHGSDVVKLRKT